MDLGCYCLHAQRALADWAGGEPTLREARAGLRSGTEQIDERLEARLEFQTGASGTVKCNMAGTERVATYRIVGSRGEATAMEFVEPHLDDQIHVATPNGERTERLGKRPTYSYQLDAFTAAVRGGSSIATGVDDALANMRLIDECYQLAGLQPRPRAAIDPAAARSQQPRLPFNSGVIGIRSNAPRQAARSWSKTLL
jgi:hypothetical protein